MQLGTVLAQRYRIDALLGEGGMGVVYKAHDTLLDRPVAVKTLSPHLIGEEGLKRLLREAQSAAKLTYPNIVAIHDVIDEGARRLIIMEHVEGRPLTDLLPLEISRAIDIGIQVCRALQYAHDRGIVHRDIKPENILVTAEGVAKVTDFGLARSEGRTRLTQSGLIVGTVAYMAPEQVLGGTVDGRSDLYSLGCVLYEVLTGRKAFEGDDPFTVLSQQVNVLPAAPRWHNGAIPPTLDAIVMRLLAKDPDERMASAGAVIEALNVLTEPGAPEATTPTTPATRTTLLERIVRGKLVGRAAEVAELREHLDRALGGEGRLVLISGDPGIGKTRLAEEVAVYAHLRGAWVLRGHCYEQDVGVPYLPFIETLRQLWTLSGEKLSTELGDRVDDLGRLLPNIGRRRPETAALSPEDERIRLFDAVTHWIGLASRLLPLVFILDDVHWADQASLRLLHHLARVTRTERIVMLGTYREMELDLEHPLNDALSQMNRERLFYRLPLRRLSEDDTRAMLSGLFDVDIARELASPVYRETEGNPFFIEEVVKALVEEGKVYRQAGRWQRRGFEELEIPQSVKAVIGRRLQRAGDASQRLLTIAAIIGREFDPDVLVKVTRLEEDTVLDGLDEATRLQLIRETKVGRGAGYTFEHALIRQTLYEGLNSRRRARLHQQVGEALEALYANQLDDHIEELAYHFGEAGQNSAQKGIDYNLRAAQRAGKLYALEEGERRLKVALELAERQKDIVARASVLRALGDLYALFVENQRAAGAYEKALNILSTQGEGASEDLPRLHLKIAELSTGWSTDILPNAPTYAQTAVELLKDSPDTRLKARALSVLAMHRARAGDLASARTYAEQAIGLATRLGDQDELVKAYRAMATVHGWGNEPALFREVMEKIRALPGRESTAADADLYDDLILAYVTAGNVAEAERVGREFLKLAERLRSPTATFRAQANLASVLLGSNKWDEALQHAERAIELGQGIRGVDYLFGRAMATVARILTAQGPESLARERISQIEAMRYDLPPEHYTARLTALGLARRLEDRERTARLLSQVEREEPRCIWCKFLFHHAIGTARVWLGDVEGAQARLQQAQQFLPANPDPDNLGALALLRAQIAEARGDLDAAVEQAADAIRLGSGEPNNIYLALYRQDAARIYLHRGRPEDVHQAHQLLGEALKVYQAVGATRHESEVKALLSAGRQS